MSRRGCVWRRMRRSGRITYLWGVYHVHSTMSDGLQSPEEIAAQARATGVSLVLLTDHGRPNLASSSFRKIIDGVTIVGGSEASLPDGHLTFFGAQEVPGFRLSSFPPEAMDDARGWGGFPVLAYPDDPDYGWRYWDSDLRPGGIEVLNLFTCLRGASWAERSAAGDVLSVFALLFFEEHYGSGGIAGALGWLSAAGQDLGIRGFGRAWRLSHWFMAFDESAVLCGHVFVCGDGDFSAVRV